MHACMVAPNIRAVDMLFTLLNNFINLLCHIYIDEHILHYISLTHGKWETLGWHEPQTKFTFTTTLNFYFSWPNSLRDNLLSVYSHS